MFIIIVPIICLQSYGKVAKRKISIQFIISRAMNSCATNCETRQNVINLVAALGEILIVLFCHGSVSMYKVQENGFKSKVGGYEEKERNNFVAE